MGSVYSAYDAQLDRKIAIKVLHPHLVFAGGDTSGGQLRLLREAQAMARLSHPNIVAIHDVGTFGDQVFLAMEHVEGETMREWLKTKPSWEASLALLREVSVGRRVTQTGSILGTVGYLAPEQGLGEDVDARSDQFGFAATLYVASTACARSPSIRCRATSTPRRRDGCAPRVRAT